MDYLELENERLKNDLRQALDEIASLREENLQLKSQLKDPQAKIKQVVKEQQANQEGLFITKGAENPTVPCENW
jgi:regulator of replication initiation timing